MAKGFVNVPPDPNLPLSRVLQAVIHAANQQVKSEHSLQMFAHRFALHPGYWSVSEKMNFETNLIILIRQYILYLPTLIEDCLNKCRQLGWTAIADDITQILEAYFIRLDTHSNDSQVGIIALLDKIYFSHRIIEELHDHMMCFIGRPLQKWNMTTTNLLVHQLIGEEYSSRLDETVIELIHKILVKAPEPQPAVKKNQTFAWPCFCEQYGFSLSLQ